MRVRWPSRFRMWNIFTDQSILYLTYFVAIENPRPPNWQSYLPGLRACIDLPTDASDEDREAANAFLQDVVRHMGTGWYKYQITPEAKIEEQLLANGPANCTREWLSPEDQFYRFRRPFYSLKLDPRPPGIDSLPDDVAAERVAVQQQTALNQIRSSTAATDETVSGENGNRTRADSIPTFQPLAKVRTDAYMRDRYQAVFGWLNLHIQSGTGLPALHEWHSSQRTIVPDTD